MTFFGGRAPRPLFFGCAGVLVAALILGGGTRPGLLSDLVLQLIALPLLALSLWSLLGQPNHRPPRAVLLFCGLLALIPVVQLLPLPASLWSALPQREAPIETYRLLQQQPAWPPLSLAPTATWLSWLSLVVPLAVFLAAAQLGYAERRALTLLVLGVSTVAVFLGLSQIAFGQAGAIRFYDFSNTTEATGFFANRNHFAALLYCAFLLAVAWAIEASLGAAGGRSQARYALGIAAAFCIMIALVAAQAMARSRAGLVLAIVAMLAALAVAIGDRRQASSHISPTKLLGGAITIAVMFGAQFALFRIMQRFAADPLQDARIAFGQTTLEAAKALMPTGAGLGTFVPVYALFEKPSDLLPNVFANRAHNDGLEFWLEAGVFAVACVIAFAAWYGFRARAVWRAPVDEGAPLDTALSRAATIIVALLLAHSVVDYPLRTGALAAVFALACALLIPPPRATSLRAREKRRAQGAPSTAKASGEPSFAPEQVPSKPLRWRQDADWPDAWRTKS